MDQFDVMLLTHDDEAVIYQPVKNIFVTTDGSFITLWVVNERSRCKFIHRFSQLDKDKQIDLAKEFVNKYLDDVDFGNK